MSKHTASDTLHKKLYIECKYQKKWAFWKIGVDTIKKAQLENKIPVLVVKEKGKKGTMWIIHEDYLHRFSEAIRETHE